MTVCCRCNALLHRNAASTFERPIALALAAALAMMLASAFPIVTLNLPTQTISTTLIDTVLALWTHDMASLAVLVAVTTLIAPALEIVTVLHVSVHLRAGVRPPLARTALRMLHGIEEWNMTEVFMLGALVALVKLGDYAQVEYGIALWSLGVVMALLVAIGASFDEHAAWQALESCS